MVRRPASMVFPEKNIIDPIIDYGNSLLVDGEMVDVDSNEVIELRSGVDFYEYAVKYQLPLLETHGLDYPDSGSWQPATEVFKKMDLDRFTIPVTVEWADEIKKMKGYTDVVAGGTKEIRLMITATVSGDYVDKTDGSGGWRFIHSKWDGITYEMILLDEDNYSMIIPESFMDVIPESMIEMNKTTAEGREQNASFEKMTKTMPMEDGVVRIRKFSGITPLRIKISYDNNRNKDRDFGWPHSFATPLKVQAEIKSEPHKVVTRKDFREAADGKEYDIESYGIYHPNTDKKQTYVWVPRPTLGLMNWWPTLP